MFKEDCMNLANTILEGVGDMVLWGEEGHLRSSDSFYEQVARQLIELILLYPDRAQEIVKGVLLAAEALPECRSLTLLAHRDGASRLAEAQARHREAMRDLTSLR